SVSYSTCEIAIVIPRCRASGALSIESNERKFAPPLRANTLVIAAVVVVFPWSTCPIVPMFTCGFVRSNFCFATASCNLRVRGGPHQARTTTRVEHFRSPLTPYPIQADLPMLTRHTPEIQRAPAERRGPHNGEKAHHA